MATLVAPLIRVKSRLPELLTEDRVHAACREAKHAWRQRVLGPPATVYLLLLQFLARVAMIGVGRVAGLSVSAAAIGKARDRLPVAVFRRLLADTASWPTATATAAAAAAPARGRRVFIADGTTFTTPDTPELGAAFGHASNQHGGGARSGFPVMRTLALMDHASGAIAELTQIPTGLGEQSTLAGVLGPMAAGDVLLLDAGLVGYAQFATLAARGVHFLAQLPRRLVVRGRGRGVRRRTGRLGQGDLLVRWDKPDRRPDWVAEADWDALPASLSLRQVALELHRPGFRSRWIWCLTSLTDPAADPARSVADLYGRRYAVEVGFRDLKVTLGMGKLSARSVDGVTKQMLGFAILYNLVRRVMAEAAARQGVAADRVGFADALRVLLYDPPGRPVPPLRVNPRRRRPTQPRARKHGGYRFPKLRGQRPPPTTPCPTARVGGRRSLS